MAKKLSSIQKLHNRTVKRNATLFSTPEGKELLNMLANGKNNYLKFNRFESNSMDFEWVKRIIACIPSISEIVEKPKKTIQTLTEVVQVEKVKKVGVETVQHLSSHTQFIKTIDENGDVTPSKLLNIYNDDYYAIYENKFIATLLRRLLIFVEKRYQVLKDTASMSNVNVLYAKNKTVVDNNLIEIETKVTFNHPASSDSYEKMRGYMHQIEDIRRYIKFYMHTEFMHILRKEKDVRNPILQTNIIRKNPQYHKCYLLWLYINTYRESSIGIKVEEDYADLTKQEIKQINEMMANNFLLLNGGDIVRTSKRKIKVYKPKIMNTYDDEIYKPKFYDGPIEYIRVDDRYRAYTESLLPLNPHPTKAQAQYNLEGYQQNKKTKEKTKQINSLRSRKRFEEASYEANERACEEREKQRDAYIDARAEKEVREEAIARMNEARKKLLNEAKWDKEHEAELLALKKELKPLEDIKKAIKELEK